MTKEARKYVLEQLCDSLCDEGYPKVVRKGPLVGKVTEMPRLDQNNVEYQVNSLLNTGHIADADENGESLYIRPSGVSTYESLSGERVRPNGAITKLLQTLDEAKRETPSDPSVTRTELKRVTGLGEDAIDRTIRYLLETGDIETVSTQTATFLTAEITNAGRERLE